MCLTSYHQIFCDEYGEKLDYAISISKKAR
jgi:hypothetical protein